jgi:hypothetical protein
MTDLDAIRDRDAADFLTDPDTVNRDLAKGLMEARADRRALLTELAARPTDTRTTTEESGHAE